MDWARKRTWIVFSIFGAIAALIIAPISFFIFHRTPTCFDGKKNGTETGIDCGGSTCTTVCNVDVYAPVVTFARALSQSGRQDLIAYIQNPNAKAFAKDAEVHIDVYGQDSLVAHKTGVLTLPANMTTPLFIPGIANYPVTQIFVTFASGTPTWTKGNGWRVTPPKASNIIFGGTTASPRITATLTNQTAYQQTSIPLIASVFDARGTIIASSQTIVPALPAQGTTQAVFTWNEPFTSPPARVDIIPVFALPHLVP